MLQKQITYTDYNDVQRTENFHFNLSKAELMEMQLGTNGGLSTILTKIIEEQNIEKITEHFKTIILKSYGEKSPDGKHFVKSEAISTAFSQTEAYSELFIELASNADAASDFINALKPKGI